MMDWLKQNRFESFQQSNQSKNYKKNWGLTGNVTISENWAFSEDKVIRTLVWIENPSVEAVTFVSDYTNTKSLIRVNC